MKVPFIEKGKLRGESDLREEIKNALWEIVKIECLQISKNNNSRLRKNP